MLVVSCHDVDALRDALLRKQDGAVYGHLEAVLDRHVLIVPAQRPDGEHLDLSGIGARGDRGVRVTRATQLWQDLLKSRRVVRVEMDDGVRKMFLSKGVTGSGACCAAAFCAAKADVLVAIPPDVEKIRAGHDGGDGGEVSSLEEYPFTRTARRAGEQAYHLEGCASDKMIRDVLKPLVAWAKSVTLIDRYAGRRLAGLSDRSCPEWKIGQAQARYQEFVRTLVRVWQQSGKATPWCGRIVLCTEYAREMGDAKRQKALIASAAEECIGKGEGSADTRRVRIEVQLKKDVGHDRYLLTDMDFVLGFTHGFDFLCEGVCDPCDVYVRRLGQDRRTEVVSRVLTAPEVL